jgi:hypothetical protein
MPEVV